MLSLLLSRSNMFFETLWKNAIPAKKRIREIEEGTKREFVETIRDSPEVQRIGFDLIKNAEDEILVLFSTPDAFFFQEKAGGGALDLLKEASSRNVKVGMLIAAADDDNNNNNTDGMRAAATTKTMTNERRRIIIRQLKESGIDVRRITQKHQENFLQNNNLALLLVDQSSYLTVELNYEAKETYEEEAMELATYSNSEATVFAYISIFENLWMRTQV
jgi:hypothetical protein